MNEKSQGDPININIIENIFRTENITHLLQTLKITTSAGSNINIIKEIANNLVNKSILFEIPNAGCVGENKILLDINIYMVQMIHDSTSPIPAYEVLATPASPSELSKSQCPSIEKYTEAEFWNVYFWGYNNWVEATPFEFGFDSDSQFDLCYPAGDMNIVTEWTGEGAIISIEDTNDSNKNEFDVIWNRMKNEILNMFRGCDIELLIRSGATIKLRAKVFDKPIGDLAGVPWREKRHYAGLLFSKYMRLEGFIERALHDLKTK